MSDEGNTRSSSESDNVCVVCFKNVDVYSVGVCDHPVCYECSIRMRVLCRQNECPICRQDMPKVIFTKTVEPFSVLFPKFERTNLQDRRHGLLFCTSDIKKAYDKLLEHRCQICGDKERSWAFRTFQQLKDHMRREHELFYCDICVENVRIFTFERRCYTRQELGQHRRKGDPDNTSHRGHPLCEFCDSRYMDNDELFRHLRRTHMFCHFCDADGKHQYYNDLEHLVRHFKLEHHLCEEGDCKSDPLTSVFRTDIDLKAHIASEHSRYMSKSATKQARTLELEFTLAPRPRNDVRSKRYTGRGERQDDEITHHMEPGGPGGGGEGNNAMFVNPLTGNDFPALGRTDVVLQRPITTVNFTSKVNSTFSRKDFPSLGGSRHAPNSEVTITAVRGQQQQQQHQQQQKSSSKSNENFPALGGSTPASSTVKLSVNSPDNAAKLSIHVNHRPNGAITTHITTSAATSTQQRAAESFPVLGSSTNVTQPQWVKVKNKKAEPKASKVAPAPTLPPSDLEQFPSLSKKKSGSPPVPPNWVNLNKINATKEQSKQGNSNRVNSSDSGVKKSEGRSGKSKTTTTTTAAVVVDNKPQDLNSDSKSKGKKKKGKSNIDEDTSKGGDVTNSHSKPEKSLDKSKIETTNNNNNNLVNGLDKKPSKTNTPPRDESPGTTPPPPGFNMKPPPGFTPSAFPPLGNDLTFTTSRGQRYSIASSSNYHSPNNFQARNQNLIKRLMSVLNNNDSIKEFKTYSDLFRNGGYPTANYYDHCKAVMGAEFDRIFPELLVLLPDIQKQQELYGFYDGEGRKNLVPCEHCKQIIFKKELSEHYNYHVLENEFPTLGKVYQVDNAWRK